MHKRAQAITIIPRVIRRTVGYKEAAQILGVSLRTIHNYVRRFLNSGPEGLHDHRRGHFRKIGPNEEIRIVACKLDSPHRSARWIRDRLQLPVSVETVRQVLLKHELNRINLQPSRRVLPSYYKWDPF
jgi:transposase